MRTWTGAGPSVDVVVEAVDVSVLVIGIAFFGLTARFFLVGPPAAVVPVLA